MKLQGINNDHLAHWLKHDSDSWNVKCNMDIAQKRARRVDPADHASYMHAVLDATKKQLVQEIIPVLSAQPIVWAHLTPQSGRDAAERYLCLFYYSRYKAVCAQYARLLWKDEHPTTALTANHMLQVFRDIQVRLDDLFDDNQDKLSIRSDWPRIPTTDQSGQRIVIERHPRHQSLFDKNLVM